MNKGRVTITGPSPMVQQMAQQNYAMKNGGDKNDLSSLSAALNSAGVSSPSSGREFTADDTKRDGGFFGWIKGLAPKFRPGRRDGETDEEYDMRHTQNMQRFATFADAIRHMGNIVNTYKGGPLQRFNDPTDYLLAGYEKRNAQRQAKAAFDADAAFKQANLSLKERAAEAQRAYQQATLGYRQAELQRKADKDKADLANWQAEFDFKVAKDSRDFEHKKIREKIKDGQWRAGYGIKVANLRLSKARLAHTLAKDAKGGANDKGYRYATPYGFLSSKNQISSQQEEQMWNFMIKNGQITKKKMAEYRNAANGSTSRARKVMQESIAYGLMDATRKGDSFRKFCTTQLGMGEDRLYNTPQNPTTWKRGSAKQGQTGKWSI